MATRCMRGLLIFVGVVLLLATFLPVTSLLPIPDRYDTAFVSAKLLMLPIGAMCLGAAATLARRVGRH